MKERKLKKIYGSKDNKIKSINIIFSFRVIKESHWICSKISFFSDHLKSSRRNGRNLDIQIIEFLDFAIYSS